MAESLWAVCEDRFFPLRPVIRSAHTKNQFRFAINDLAECLERTPTIADLTDDNLARLMNHLTGRGLSEVTINERCRRLKTIWVWLCKRGELNYWPTIGRLPEQERVPRAWSAAELSRLFASFAHEPGTIAGIPASAWWLTQHAWYWCTGARKGETFAVEWSMVDLDAQVAVVPASVRKGKQKCGIYPLWPELVSLLREIRLPQRTRVWPWPWCVGMFYKRYDRILKRAGLPTGRYSKAQAMRITYSTWQKIIGNDPTALLRHSDPATTWKSYLDLKLIIQHSPNNGKPPFIPWRPE